MRLRAFLSLPVVSLLGCNPVLYGEILVVQPGSVLDTISDALALACDGDTIMVKTGSYEESISIQKSVRLISDGSARVVGPGKGDVLYIAADDVHVQGFTITGSGSNMMASDAGIKISGSRAKVVGNVIGRNLFGVYLKGCKQALVEENLIEGKSEDEMGKRGAGVHFFDASENLVRRNRVRHVRDGVYFDHSDFNTVEENEFSDLRYGVHYMYCEDNSFYRNVFRNSVGGVAVMYTERVVFRENQIVHNRLGYSSFGLLLKDCLDSVADGNVILNNVNGIYIDSSHRNKFTGNLVAYNDVAVRLFASSLANTFSGNDFIGNQAVLHTVGRADADWSPGGSGNYYSDYSGYDLDGDGVGDYPHRLQDAFEFLLGNRPRLQLFVNSAAGDALALAEKTFPLVPTSDELDSAPRMKPQASANYRLAGTLQVGGGSPAKPLVVAVAFSCLLIGSLWSWRRLR